LGRLIAGNPYHPEINFLGYGSICGYHLIPMLSESDLRLSDTEILVKAYIQYTNALLNAVGYPELTIEEKNVEFISTDEAGFFSGHRQIQMQIKRTNNQRSLKLIEEIIDDAIIKTPGTDKILNNIKKNIQLQKNEEYIDINRLKSKYKRALQKKDSYKGIAMLIDRAKVN
jgi:hypothetical protein